MDCSNSKKVWLFLVFVLGILGVFWIQTFWNFNADGAHLVNLAGATSAAPENEKQSILTSEFLNNAGTATLFLMLAQFLEKTEREMKAAVKSLCDAITLEREECVQRSIGILDLKTRFREIKEDIEKWRTSRRQEEEGFPPRCKHEKDQQTLLDRIQELKEENGRLEGDLRAKDFAKDHLEEQILKLKGDKKELTARADELTETNDDLKAEVVNLNVQLAKITCQLQQQENLAHQLQEEKDLLDREKQRLEGRNREQSDAINRFQTEEGERKEQIRHLEKRVGELKKEVEVLQIDLEGKEYLANLHKEQCREEQRRLGEMTKKCLDVEAERGNLELKWEKLEYDCLLLRMELDHTKKNRDRLEWRVKTLERQLMIIVRWRDEVGAGIERTDRKLGREPCFS